MEASSKIFDGADVTARGIFRVITTLEFLQHYFSEMGHRDLLVTQPYLNRQATTAPFASRAASAARRLRSNGILGMWESAPLERQKPHSEKRTSRDLAVIGNN